MKIYEWIRRAKSKFYPGSIVLMYHRIASPDTDPWMLTVSAANFEQQLQVLKKQKMVVPMAHLVEQLYSGKKIKPCVVLTFDDGYVDNFLEAKPLLEKYEIPATFFISNKHIGIDKEFWWDELADLLLSSPELPTELTLFFKGSALNYELKGEESLTEDIYQKHKTWKYTQTPPTKRSKIYMELWRLLSPITYHEQQQFIESLKSRTGVTKGARKSCLSMTEKQLIKLAAADLFTIGAHTVSHPALAYYAKDIQFQEIAQNKKYLEAITGVDINTFAYPSGNFNDTTVQVLKQQEFVAAFTTQPRTVAQAEDPFRIGRYQILNLRHDEFSQSLRTMM